ncbi:MAG: T9SS type A sorting domain-containing protein [Bacteroidetes bacterium]|nr:T9SS type A sorting domain-containing protein [Bacteroidota bacterium]
MNYRFPMNSLCCAFALAVTLVVTTTLVGCQSDEDSLAEFHANGARYFEEERYEEAVIEYKNVIKLNPNHWALVDGDSIFDTKKKGNGGGSGRSYTTTDTGGCSCEQIIDELDLGEGHRKHGCSNSAMDEWVTFVQGTSKRGAGNETEITAEAPESFALKQNYPNPFNPSTTIQFDLPETAQVTLVVYDVLGRQVRVLVDGTREAGTHEVTFDASGLPSGVYVYRIEAGPYAATRTMLLMK